MVARDEFVNAHRDVIRAFIRGWFEGTEKANSNQDLVVKLLMENEAVYKDLGEQATRDGIGAVRWADITDNTRMFGLDGNEPLFDRIFRQAGNAWLKRGYITAILPPAEAKDDSFLKEIYGTTYPAPPK